jgi:hypothetical protein
MAMAYGQFRSHIRIRTIMHKYIQYALIAACSVLLLACTDKAAAPKAPIITAQGFDINEIQSGTVNHFGDLKLRIEAAGRIEHLYIKERSYEVDLAKSPEPAHFPLFGLPHRTEAQTDITLNFKNYINEKLTTGGPYEFLIEVSDKKGRAINATLKIEVYPAAKEATMQLSPVKTAGFQLQRIGLGRVTGYEGFGIEWITADEIHVGIEIKKTTSRTGQLHQLSREDYTAIKTRADLTRLIAPLQPQDVIHIDTANNAATGHSFAVSDGDQQYALLISSSATSLSEVGTTVTLTGEYKF